MADNNNTRGYQVTVMHSSTHRPINNGRKSQPSHTCHSTHNGGRLRARKSTVALLVVVAAALTACGGKHEDLQTYIADVKAQKKSTIPALPTPEAFEVFAYNEAVLRDPFVPKQAVVATSNSAANRLKPDQKRERDVLEQFPVGSLKMMGSLEKDGKRWALIKTADGTLHRTTQGRYLGQNDGKIIQINETKLELKEIVPDGLGGWVERMTTLSVNE